MDILKTCSCGTEHYELPADTRAGDIGNEQGYFFECHVCHSTLYLPYSNERARVQFLILSLRAVPSVAGVNVVYTSDVAEMAKKAGA